MNLGFADGAFDLVFGSGIVHHLDTRKASQEVARVLRPGGRAVFWEPMGTNPAISLYRKATPNARTVDEHPLLKADLGIMRQSFGSVDVAYFGLTSLLALPFRGASFGPAVRGMFDTIDSALLALPGVKALAWYAKIVCTK